MNPEQMPMMPSADILSVGQRLRERRQALGWSIDQASSRIKYSVRQITLLEQDRFSDLPGGATLKGMVRNYARALDIPAEPLLQRLSPELTAAVPITRPVGASLGTMPGERGGMMRPAAARSAWVRLALPLVVMVLLAVAAAVVLAPGLLDALRNLGSTPDAPVVMPASEGDSQAATPAPAEPVSVPAPSEPLEASGNGAPVSDPAAATAVSSGLQAPPATPSPAAPSTAPSAAGVLELVAREESWIEVRDAPGGTVVFSRLMTPGMRERLSLPAASVLVGNASGMEVRWNGSALDLSTLQRNNVARINLP